MKHSEYLEKRREIQQMLDNLNETLKKELNTPSSENFEKFDDYVETLTSAAEAAAKLRAASAALVQEYATGAPAQVQEPVEEEEVPVQEIVDSAPAQEQQINMQEVITNAVTGITALASVFQAFRKR